MQAIQHIAFNCRNARETERFYARHFGFRRARIFAAGTPNEFVILRLGAACLELFQAAPGNTELSGREQPVGFAHLAFEVPDLDAAIAALKADGIEPDPIIDCENEVSGMRVVFFNDIDGNRLELMEGYKDQFEE
jgi:glyoxylase I family protein